MKTIVGKKTFGKIQPIKPELMNREIQDEKETKIMIGRMLWMDQHP